MSRSRRTYVRDARGRFAPVPGRADRMRRERRRRAVAQVGATALRRQAGPVLLLGHGLRSRHHALSAVAGAQIVTGLAIDANELHHALRTTARSGPRRGHVTAYRHRRQTLTSAARSASRLDAHESMQTALSLAAIGQSARTVAHRATAMNKARKIRRTRRARSRAAHRTARLAAQRRRKAR